MVRPCQYQPKKGKHPCQRLARDFDDFCIIHKPLKGERIKCVNCKQMIKKGSTTHSQKCSSLSLKTASLPFYCHNCNIEPSDLTCTSIPVDDHPVDEEALAARVEAIYMAHSVDFLEDIYLMNPDCEDSLLPTSSYASTPAQKHRLQEEGIITCMEKHGILNHSSGLYVEFGAGKGSLSKAVSESEAACVAESRFICIERSAYKHKAENNEHMRAYRARIDLSDVNLHALVAHTATTPAPSVSPTVKSSGEVVSESSEGLGVVGMGKHVCGGATDLSLRALSNFLRAQREASSTLPLPSASLKGISLALCCHGLCSWDCYVGRSWLQHEAHITPGEFEYLRKWSGFFVVDKQQLQAMNSHPSLEEVDNHGIVPAESNEKSRYFSSFSSRARLGQMCKRVIDFGRMHFVRIELGLRPRLVQFVHDAVTPENMLLLAT